MFKVIKDNKIIAVAETTEIFGLNYDSIEQDSNHNVDDYEQSNNEYLLKTDIPVPTKQEQGEKRAAAYKAEVDTITLHIIRLRDQAQTPEIAAKIATLITERDEKVASIKERYPYFA